MGIPSAFDRARLNKSLGISYSVEQLSEAQARAENCRPGWYVVMWLTAVEDGHVVDWFSSEDAAHAYLNQLNCASSS